MCLASVNSVADIPRHLISSLFPCQLPVSGSLLSVQISGAYPCNTPVAQCPPCLTRDRSEEVSTQCEKEGEECGWTHCFGEGKRQRAAGDRASQQARFFMSRSGLLLVRGPGELRNAERGGRLAD